MTNNLDELRQKRRKWVEANRENGFEDGIKRLLTDLYPDNAHFIYELLQNAEDTHATTVRFTLTDSAVEFEHDGKRLFSLKDVEAITSIGTSTKHDDPTSIGKFGVGFKAVFAYTNTPEVHSGDFHFRIHDLVIPEIKDVSRSAIRAQQTSFRFPFNNPRKSANQAVVEIERSLRALDDSTLLFLSHISTIEYLLPSGDIGSLVRIESDGGFIRIRKESSSSHWLRLLKDVPVEDENGESKICCIGIAYRLVGGNTRKIYPEQDGQVSIFFPAEKETSNLRFHLHAPFASTVARDSVRDCKANQLLRDALAELAAESLIKIRDLDMLTGDFLSVLPNPQDNLPAFYEPIRQSIVRAFKGKRLTPTKSGSYEPSVTLYRGPARISDVLSDADITLLTNIKSPFWAANPSQQNQREDRFLDSLGMNRWGWSELANALADISDDAEEVERVEKLISNKDDTWLLKLYALLGEAYDQHDAYTGAIGLRIVRVETDKGDQHVLPEEAFFLPDDEATPPQGLHFVKSTVYATGRLSVLKKNLAKSFLEWVGVRTYDAKTEIEIILNQQYTRDNFKPLKSDLKSFIALLDKEPDKAGLFAGYFIFERKDGKWGQPGQVFLDQPFKDTGLGAYYDQLDSIANSANARPVALADSYLDCGIDVIKLAKFAEAVGAQTRLHISETSCYDNPKWLYLSSVRGERHTSPINKDYIIYGFDVIFRQPSIAISKLIWNTMCTLPRQPDCLRATYQINDTWGSRYEDSQLVHKLKTTKWVPQGGDIFVLPAEAVQERLPAGFPFDPGWVWIKKIEFGQEAVNRSDAYHKKQIVAQESGFDSAEELEKWKRLKDCGISPDEIFVQYMLHRHISPPEESVPNPERRRKLVLENMANAPSKESVKRERSIQTGVSEITAQARAYLRAKYRNSEEQLFCQCCHEEMPFRLPSGDHYFEAVQCVRGLDVHHNQNRLALCPTCAAMYQYARETDDAELRRRIVDHPADDQAPSVEIPVRLAGREHTLHFVASHWIDLNTVLGEGEAP